MERGKDDRVSLFLASQLTLESLETLFSGLMKIDKTMNCRWPLGAEDSFQIARSQGSPFYNCKKRNFANNPNDLGSRLSIVKFPYENTT